MEKRRQRRVKKRLACEMLVAGQRHRAIVRDISPTGLFVQTRARPEPGSSVELVFRAEGARPEIRAEASVARERVVPNQFRAAVADGIGLELRGTPDGLEALLDSAVGPDASATGSRPNTDGPSDRAVRSFRVKLTQRNGPQSRVLTVRCESAASARAQALARAGRGAWKVDRVQEI